MKGKTKIILVIILILFLGFFSYFFLRGQLGGFSDFLRLDSLSFLLALFLALFLSLILAIYMGIGKGFFLGGIISIGFNILYSQIFPSRVSIFNIGAFFISGIYLVIGLIAFFINWSKSRSN